MRIAYALKFTVNFFLSEISTMILDGSGKWVQKTNNIRIKKSISCNVLGLLFHANALFIFLQLQNFILMFRNRFSQEKFFPNRKQKPSKWITIKWMGSIVHSVIDQWICSSQTKNMEIVKCRREKSIGPYRLLLQHIFCIISMKSWFLVQQL